MNGRVNPPIAPLDVQEQLTAKQLMEKSFAALLKNHRWNFYLEGKTEAQMIAGQRNEFDLYTDLDQQLIAISVDLGESDPDAQLSNMEEMGIKVIDNVPQIKTLPSPGGDEYSQLLATVFDVNRYMARLNSAIDNWKILLNKAKTLNIPVISQTYCYPFFSEEATSVLGWEWNKRTGPWFKPRFEEARIIDRRIRRICLKAVLDNFKWYVLDELKKPVHEFDFDYVDVRNVNPLMTLWRDEMHLKPNGFKKIAEAIYNKIEARFSTQWEN
jgi:hypothetical protein